MNISSAMTNRIIEFRITSLTIRQNGIATNFTQNEIERANLSFSYEKGNNEVLYEMIKITDVKSTSTSYIPGINLVFGLNYEISDNFVFGAEILPGFSCTSGTHVSKGLPNGNVEDLKTNISGYSFGLSNNSVLLTLAYRFKM